MVRASPLDAFLRYPYFIPAVRGLETLELHPRCGAAEH